MADQALDLEALAPFEGRRMEQVVAVVRSAVNSGTMTPGVKYSAYQLAETLGVSRTPVRDALLRLEEIGLVKFEPRQGFRILLPQPKEIAEIFAIRLALEIPAVRAVASAPDTELVEQLREQQRLMDSAAESGNETVFAGHDLHLHDLILGAAGNARARTIVTSLRETVRLLGISTADRTRSLADINAEHAPIVDAIVDADPAAAADAMQQHLEHTGILLIGQALRLAESDLSAQDVWAEVAPDN